MLSDESWVNLTQTSVSYKQMTMDEKWNQVVFPVESEFSFQEKK